MSTWEDTWQEYLSDDLSEVATQLRARRHEPTDLRLDELKREALARPSRRLRAWRGRKFVLRSRAVTLALVLGLLLCTGGAGVIAAGTSKPGTTATKTEYKCNSGNGNGSEVIDPVGGTGPADCDPGNSSGNNSDNPKEGDNPSIPPP